MNNSKSLKIKSFELRIDYYLSLIEMHKGEGKTLENRRKGFEKSITVLTQKIEDVKNEVETVSPLKVFRSSQKDALKVFLADQKLKLAEWKKENGIVEKVKETVNA